MTSIRHVEQKDLASWLRLRHALWPDTSEQEHRAEIQRFLAGTARDPEAVLVACDEQSGAVIGFSGFVEVGVIRCFRKDLSAKRVQQSRLFACPGIGWLTHRPEFCPRPNSIFTFN